MREPRRSWWGSRGVWACQDVVSLGPAQEGAPWRLVASLPLTEDTWQPSVCPARSPGGHADSSSFWHLQPCAQPALHLVSPGQGSNLVPFSILEALLRIKNWSNDGKESQWTAALYPPSCQGLNEPSGGFRVMRARLPAGMMHGPRDGSMLGEECAAQRGPVQADPAHPCSPRIQGARTVKCLIKLEGLNDKDRWQPWLFLISWLTYLAFCKKVPKDTAQETTNPCLLRVCWYVCFTSLVSIS